MKKLSKILVVVLTLAMLLGVIVVSASASDKAVDVLDSEGNVIASTDSLDEALATANANTTAGDITVKINKDVKLNKAVTITRDADEYGKVIIDLGGNALDVSAVTNRDYILCYLRTAGKGYAAPVDVIWVKASETADAVPYDFTNGFAFDGEIKDEAGEAVAADDLVAGGTYIGTPTAASYQLGYNYFYKGALNVGTGASLVVDGNGGSITRGSGSTVFHIAEDAEDAELLVRDLSVTTKSYLYFCSTYNGVATFDGVSITSTDTKNIFRHGADSKLNIKNSYIYAPNGDAANCSVIMTEATGTNSNDGYDICVENCTVQTAQVFIASASADMSASAFYIQYTAGADGKTKFTYFTDRELRLKANEGKYAYTDVKVENCNVEIVNYNNGGRSDSTALAGQGQMANIDFIKCNLFVNQRGVWAYGGGENTVYVNFYDCYFELTGKGTLYKNLSPAFLALKSKTVVNFYNTELRVSDLLKNSTAVGTAALSNANYLANYGAMTFYAGCLFDAECAPNTDDLKARISGGKYLVNDAGEMIVLGIDFTKTDVAGKLTIIETTGDALTAGATSGAFNPIVALAGGNKLTEAGDTTSGRQTFSEIGSKGWNVYTSQGIQRVVEEADGNKYVCYDPSSVKNDMTGYTYTAAADFADVTLPDGVTALGGWDIDKDSVLEYLDTDGNVKDAEYANVAANGAGYSWTAIPDRYEKNYANASSPWYTIGSKYLYAPDYEYITYSFDYKNSENSDYFIPLCFSVQGRREFGVSADSGTRNFTTDEHGNVYLTGTKTGVSFVKDQWNNVTIIVELVETKVSTGAGHYVDATNRGDVSYTDSVVHVFINGEKAGTFKTGWNVEHGWVCALRGNFSVTNQTWLNNAIAGGAQMCIDNVREIGYLKGYESAELSALLAGTETNLDTWSESIFALHKNEVTDFPAAKDSAAQIVWTPSVNSSKWNTLDKDDGTNKNANTDILSTTVEDTVMFFDSAEDAIAHGAKMTVKLLADAEKVLVDAPATVDTNGKKLTYYSNEFKTDAGAEAAIVSFVRATASDFVEITYAYPDEEPATATLVKGSYFWFDEDKLPKVLKFFDDENARDVQLMLDGKVVDSLDDLNEGFVVTEAKSYVFSYETLKQYGWMIYDSNKEFSGLSADIGETYAELVNRVKNIEKQLDFFANDSAPGVYDGADFVTDENGVVLTNNAPTFIDTYLKAFDEKTANLRTKGYTIKLFKDFDNAATIYTLSYGAGKVVNYDLNGHTVSYTGTAIYSYGASAGLEYDPKTGAVEQWHGTYIKNGVPTAGSTLTIKDSDNALHKYIPNSLIKVNIFSSEPGAKMIGSSSKELINYSRQERTKYKKYGTTSDTVLFEYTIPVFDIGNETTSSAIGPDENVIDVETNGVVFYNWCYTSGDASNVRNLNVIGGYKEGIISLANHKTKVYNCNFIYTYGGNDRKGVINLGTSTIFADITRCNIVSTNVVNLFNHAGNRGESTSNYVKISDSRLYNTKLTATATGYGQQNDLSPIDRSAMIATGCYYNIPYEDLTKTINTVAAKQANSKTSPTEWSYTDKFDKTCEFKVGAVTSITVSLVTLRSDVSSADYYTPNVYANETFTINGVDYTFTYKVVSDADIVDVKWQDKAGTQIGESEKYAKGGNPVFGGAAVRVDALTKIRHEFADATIPTDHEGTEYIVTASVSKYIPAFKVATNLNLETNLKHNIKIWKYVLYNGDYVDITKKLTSVTVGGETFALTDENLNKGADAEDPHDDYYYYTVDVKSNAIASTYDLVIKFKDTTAEVVTVTQELSVAKYLGNGLAAETEGSDLYNLYGAIVNYGIAAYSYEGFKGAIGDVNVLTALAAKYPVANVEIDEAAKDVAAGKIDVEFVLDEQLEYRFKFIDQAMIDNWASLTVEISYTDINGELKTLTTNKTLVKYEGGYIDFAVDAFEFAGDVTVRTYLLVGGEVTDKYTVTYNIANYYADAKALGSSETLLTLVEALNAYATYANTYMTNKQAIS